MGLMLRKWEKWLVFQAVLALSLLGMQGLTLSHAHEAHDHDHSHEAECALCLHSVRPLEGPPAEAPAVPLPTGHALCRIDCDAIDPFTGDASVAYSSRAPPLTAL